MLKGLHLYNTLKREKVPFIPLHPPKVGLYLCGPTVYGDPHLGHARPLIVFDVLVRYLTYKGLSVRYVRNITDVGHLEGDADAGEDKIGKKARLEFLEPMEVAEHYTNRYVEAARLLNTLPPSITPRATGHIPEQVKLVESLIEKGLAYEAQGSVYFDVETYVREGGNYGILSGRKTDELQTNSRTLAGGEDKRSPLDFALWKRAEPTHLMRWQSPWGEGFPGWHIECSAMSNKYLGKTFDIHGGGLDLLFPHHECEIAQSEAGYGATPAALWMHVNMLTINGQKMGKSLGNFITLHELFAGNHEKLERPYTPQEVRYFLLTAQYRSTIDFSNEALAGAGKALDKLQAVREIIGNLESTQEGGNRDSEVKKASDSIWEALDDDLNTALALGHLHTLVGVANAQNADPLTLGKDALELLKETYVTTFDTVLGMQFEGSNSGEAFQKMQNRADSLVSILARLREEAKTNRDFATSDKLRDSLLEIGIQLKDTKNGTTWTYEA